MAEERLLAVSPHNTHSIECYSKRGFLKWAEMIPNLVTKEGAIWLLDNAFGSGLHKDWRAGLTESGTISSGDTMITKGWNEFTKTTHAARPNLYFGATEPQTAAETYVSAKAGFVVHKAGEITGSFMVDDPLIGGRAGLLYGVTLFDNAHQVVQGDSLYLIITLGSTV
jgi:hypothetical protein